MEPVNCSRIAPSSVIPICENPSMGSHPQSVGNLVCSSTSDFISNLPDDVTQNILLRLSLRDAARTSVLSKTWRHKWRYLPHLVFDFSDWMSSSSTIRDSTLVCQVLSLHRVPITKFYLNSSYREGFHPDLEPIMIFLCDTPIQEFAFCGFKDVLPTCLFSFKQLEHLKLSNCRIEPPPTFTGFCKLSSLIFDRVSFDCNLYDSLISKCPLLEHLIIVGCTIDSFVFDFPNLKSFHYQGGLSVSFSFKSAPLLEMFSFFQPSCILPFFILPFSTQPFGQTPFKPFNFLEFLKCVPTLKGLCISFICLEPSDSLTLQVRPPIICGHLRVLKIHGVSFHLAKDVIWILCLIKISPNLQKLEITASEEYGSVDDPKAMNLFDAEFLSDASLEHLLEVSIFNFSGLIVGFELVKFLLIKSAVLEKLNIESADITGGVRSLDILKLVTDFPRASQKVEIMYADTYSCLDDLDFHRFDGDVDSDNFDQL